MKIQSSFSSFTALALSATALWLVFAGPVQAEKADRNKPMAIEADALRYDDAKQISIFTGRVVLTKGTIVIRGTRLEVRQDPDGYQFGRVTGTPEQPAFFRQKREGQDEFIEGEGDSLYYDGRADTVTFTNRAQLRRYRGTTLADQITGSVIVYENLTDMFRVDGGTPGASGSPEGGGVVGSMGTGRVRAMLTPKPDASKGATP